MKTLIFIPLDYTIGQMLVEGFEENKWEAKVIDYRDYLPKWRNKLFVKTIHLTNKIKKFIQPRYFDLINRKYLEIIEDENPDLILIYNNQFFSPELLEKVKRNVKIAFFLGDDPLWSNTSDTNLTILKYSNYTLSPDSYWKKMLDTFEIPNVHFGILGYSKQLNYKIKEISDENRIKYSSDLVFIGKNYSGSAGYKRCLFHNQFAKLDYNIYGSEWNVWAKHFPELSNRIQPLNQRISNDKMNMILNCCKIYPIDQNQGIINGIHSRVFEAIGSEILPIVEYRKDIDVIFNGVGVPVIKKFSEGYTKAKYYLENESERVLKIKELKEYINANYLPKNAIRKLLNQMS